MRYFKILIAFVAILLSSCAKDEVYNKYNPSSKGGIQIIGAVEDYDIKSVGTRADDDVADSYISEMTMFIFKSNGELIQGYSDEKRTVECTSAINIQRGNPTFLIDTEEGILADLSGTSNASTVYYKNGADDLGACKIYIVANAWHQLQNKVNTIKTLSDLENLIYDVDASLAMPKVDDAHYRGFPMIGTHLSGSFNLAKGADKEGNAVATIPLKKLYSKVNFTMQINADQIVAGQIPKFTISKVEVFNVPKKAHLGREIDSNGKPVYGTTDTDDYITEMDISSTYTPSDYYYYCSTGDNIQPYVIDQFNKKTIYHSASATTDDVIEFGFYMPEHKVTPNTITYPANIEDDFKQYYKPAGVGESRHGDGSISAPKIATFVRIHGSYTDHNGQILGVKYDIYLGQNNTDDFTIKRNQLLNNKLIITGLTNHKDAYLDKEGNISIDHRVEIEDKGYNLSMERTAILDAHFEVRPLDIELSPKSLMIITIPEGYRHWIAMEDDAVARRSGENSSLYVNTSTPRKGVRKYFTTNLVSDLNANGGTITLSTNESDTTKTFRVWFYIDENPNVYDKTIATEDSTKLQDPDGTTYAISKNQYRVCPVKFKYTGTDKDGNTLVKDATINFQQWNLWRVWNSAGNRYYDIEHEEEYLNNYASDMQYGQTQDGMPWGLDGLQLSDTDNAFYIQSKIDSDAITEIFSGRKANAYKYDFYITAEESNVIDYTDKDGDGNNDEKIYHPYNGLAFTQKIASKAIATTNSATGKPYLNKERTLVEDVESAVEYCYNKNKRDDNGQVAEVKWYLPAVDEIEDIAAGAYDEFDRVFQKNFYWSSQPAYTQKAWHGTFWIFVTLNYNGFLYIDNLNYARSTSIEFVNGVKQPPTPSGMSNTNITVELGRMLQNTTPTESTDKNKTPIYDAGYDKRSEMNRIRAVYRSGEGTRKL